MMPVMAVFGADAYTPSEIAARVRDVGVVKAQLPWLSQAALGVLAGAFIGLGAMMFTLVASDASLGFAASRLLGGLVFSIAGRIPARGELVRHPSGVEFEVLEADPRRIKRLRIHVPQAPADAAATPESES